MFQYSFSSNKQKSLDIIVYQGFCCLFRLSRQVSNLNSSDPESDVLPITPRDNFEDANIDFMEKLYKWKLDGVSCADISAKENLD